MDGTRSFYTLEEKPAGRPPTNDEFAESLRQLKLAALEVCRTAAGRNPDDRKGHLAEINATCQLLRRAMGLTAKYRGKPRLAQV